MLMTRLKWIGWQGCIWGTRVLFLVVGMMLFDRLRDRNYEKAQIARGCLKVGHAGEVTEIAKGVEAKGAVWLCGRREIDSKE